MALLVASTSSQTLHSEAIIPGQLVRPAGRRAPAGTWHAFDGGSEVALCGLSLDWLLEWPDQPWERGLTTDRCRVCSEAAKESPQRS